MKKLLMMVIVLITAAALFTSCGGSGDPDSGGGSGGGSSGGGTSGGGGSQPSSSIPYIFNASSLTEDCSETDFDDFLDATGNYEFQIVYTLASSGDTEMTYCYKGKYTINDDTAGEHEVTELTEFLYAKLPNLSNSQVQQQAKESYEAQGFDVTFNGDTMICENTDALDNPSSAVPEISHSLYSAKKTCKTNSGSPKTKIYLAVDGILGTVNYYLKKIN